MVEILLCGCFKVGHWRSEKVHNCKDCLKWINLKWSTQKKIHEYNTQKTNVTGYYEMKLDNPFSAMF